MIQGLKLKMQNLSSKSDSSLSKRSYAFSLRTIRLASNFPNTRAAWVIADQLIRSATSIGANQVEARAASSRLEFKKFFEISLKSANETVYWLSLAKDAGLCKDSNEVGSLITEVEQLARMLGKSVLTLKANKF